MVIGRQSDRRSRTPITREALFNLPWRALSGQTAEIEPLRCEDRRSQVHVHVHTRDRQTTVTYPKARSQSKRTRELPGRKFPVVTRERQTKPIVRIPMCRAKPCREPDCPNTRALAGMTSTAHPPQTGTLSYNLLSTLHITRINYGTTCKHTPYETHGDTITAPGNGIQHSLRPQTVGTQPPRQDERPNDGGD